ncbi:hypothetical protein INR49_016671 [Caranx melampygus]|nr:hypothetical protein INR49_016671 [Caranx melampygus]
MQETRKWSSTPIRARSKSVTPGEGGPGQGSPRSSRSMERPLKAGWLKKQQRSLVKNWQQRYFVLRGSTLTYHKDDKETTVQGVIQLRFSKVNELPPNSDDPGKYLFEIIPRATGDRERCPYVFMASSQGDMEEWVRTLRRVIGVPTSGGSGWEKLEKQIALLPRVNYNLLSYVCRFLFEVQQHSAVNKMNVENLATVMGINLLKPLIEDPITVMKATPQIQKLMTMMIRQHEALFPLSKDVLPSPPAKKAESQKNTPRSFVGWESSEMGDTSLSESPEEEEDIDSPGPDKENSSQNPQPEPVSQSTDDWPGSPRKRTQTLPTFNCPLTGMAAKADALNRWSRIQESGEEKSGTFSEDIFKILDLRGSGSLFGGSPLSNKEGEEKLACRRGSDSAASATAGSQKPNTESQPARVLPHQKSAETLPVAAPGPQVNSKSELKEDNKQFVDTLQQENKELRATVIELQAALEAEHRRVAALEICLKNAERSRDEAQKRNEELQRDIQQFLSGKPQAPT